MGLYNSLRAKARAIQQLPPMARRSLWQAWLWLLIYDLGLRLLPLGRVQGWAGHVESHPGPAKGRDPWPRIEQLHRLVDIAARNHLYPMRCLPQALALQRLLGRQAIASQLRIGVQRGENGLAGHAWLEYQGRPIGQPPGWIESYTPLTASDAAPPAKAAAEDGVGRATGTD